MKNYLMLGLLLLSSQVFGGGHNSTFEEQPQKSQKAEAQQPVSYTEEEIINFIFQHHDQTQNADMKKFNPKTQILVVNRKAGGEKNVRFKPLISKIKKYPKVIPLIEAKGWKYGTGLLNQCSFLESLGGVTISPDKLSEIKELEEVGFDFTGCHSVFIEEVQGNLFSDEDIRYLKRILEIIKPRKKIDFSGWTPIYKIFPNKNNQLNELSLTIRDFDVYKDCCERFDFSGLESFTMYNMDPQKERPPSFSYDLGKNFFNMLGGMQCLKGCRILDTGISFIQGFLPDRYSNLESLSLSVNHGSNARLPNEVQYFYPKLKDFSLGNNVGNTFEPKILSMRSLFQYAKSIKFERISIGLLKELFYIPMYDRIQHLKDVYLHGICIQTSKRTLGTQTEKPKFEIKNLDILFYSHHKGLKQRDVERGLLTILLQFETKIHLNNGCWSDFFQDRYRMAQRKIWEKKGLMSFLVINEQGEAESKAPEEELRLHQIRDLMELLFTQKRSR